MRSESVRSNSGVTSSVDSESEVSVLVPEATPALAPSALAAHSASAIAQVVIVQREVERVNLRIRKRTFKSRMKHW